MSKFQIISDMHLEHSKKFPIVPKLADNLILAGDIGSINSTTWIDFINYCSAVWSNVFYVLGNHEYYSNNETFDELQTKYIQHFNNFPNVHILNDSMFEFDDIILYGFTGWTRSPFSTTEEGKQNINDYNYILESSNKLISPEYITNLANQSIEKLKSWFEIYKPMSKPIIIITHFPPINLSVKHNKYFTWFDLCTEEGIETSNIKYWISGHTHSSYNIVKNNVRYISNQIGYKNEYRQSNFDPFFII